MMPNLIIRTDANPRIGTGHLMRCLALAQSWRSRGGKVVFVTTCSNEDLLRQLRAEKIQIVRVEHTHPNPADWEQMHRILDSNSAAWVVLDGYHFDSGYQKKIKKIGSQLMIIDDMAHIDKYYADIILNQNINAGRLNYNVEPCTRLILGPQYALLRPEFTKRSDRRRPTPQVARKLLITLGGADPDNETLKVMQAVQQTNIDDLEVVVVIGSANPYRQLLQSVGHASQIPFRWVVNTTEMAELMAWADLSISAGGSTCLELAHMGVPTLCVILAENQRLLVEGLAEAGAAVNLGWYRDLPPLQIAQSLESLALAASVREDMTQQGRNLVDGKGTERVLLALLGK
jgi:UDP-2,4-diacetamido-2,4,6-trideoxy-beta-L-altropyranose hydrolase